jgi:hypothetical protein
MRCGFRWDVSDSAVDVARVVAGVGIAVYGVIEGRSDVRIVAWTGRRRFAD